MFPLSYGVLYRSEQHHHQQQHQQQHQPQHQPQHHPPADDKDLAGNLEYPNLNSRDYAKRPINLQLRMHPAWECMAMNDQGQITIATNKMSGREWTGSLWGFERLMDQSLLTPENACYKLQCNALVSRIQFAARNIMLLALNSGKLQVWSTYSEVRNSKNPYCMFLIGEKSEHTTPILCMDSFKKNANKILTACRGGTLKIWDMTSAELVSIITLRFAHTDAITGVESSPVDEAVFATCSLDKTALIWDERTTRPAVAVYEQHDVRFRDIKWLSNGSGNGANEHLLFLADEAGNVHDIDNRKPNKFLKTVKHFNRPVRKVLPNGHNLAIIGDTNIVKVYNTAADQLVYENSDATHLVRDSLWHGPEDLLTVGFDSKLRMHKVVS